MLFSTKIFVLGFCTSPSTKANWKKKDIELSVVQRFYLLGRKIGAPDSFTDQVVPRHWVWKNLQISRFAFFRNREVLC